MPNRCVAAGCQVTVSHFCVFLNIQICALFGPDKFSECGCTRTEEAFLDHFSVDCFDEIPALKAIYSLPYNITVC